VLKAIVQNSGLENREELVQQIEQVDQPGEMEQQQQQLQMQAAQLQLADLQADVQLKQARAAEVSVNTQIAPQELQIKAVAASGKYLQGGAEATNEFDQRLKMTDRVLKNKEIDVKKEIAQMQIIAARANQ
jgi:hypothetical protein